MNPEMAPQLLDPACYPHPVGRIELVETHISWVFLAGDYAYKLKKPVRLPFLDFSTLSARRACCEEELRLNRRTAPDLYLDVLPVAGTWQHPRIGGNGTVIEYAIQMRRFNQDDLAVCVARRGEMGGAQIDALAAVIADFHAGLAGAAKSSRQGSHHQVVAQALENFEEMGRLAAGSPEDEGLGDERLRRLHAWTQEEGERLKSVFAQRKRAGFIRECHGDLHLGNIAWVDGRPVPFDCIEFSASLRWIDVMSEVAFLVMDLLEHGLDTQAWRFLNAYLEITGDYHGLRVLNYYLVYRALVRAKIDLIRANQAGVVKVSTNATETGTKEATQTKEDRGTIAGEIKDGEIKDGETKDGETKGGETTEGGETTGKALNDANANPRRSLEVESGRYVSLAENVLRPRQPSLVVMHGLAGSGKTKVSQQLVEMLGAVRVRSDVERKRLHGLARHVRTHSGPYSGIYASETTRLTYDRLKSLVRDIIGAGFPAIVDAAFLRRAVRDQFRELAGELRVPFVILSCTAPHAELLGRVARRDALMNDASEAGIAVLENQVLTEQPLEGDELAQVMVIETVADKSVRVQRVQAIAALLTKNSASVLPPACR